MCPLGRPKRMLLEKIHEAIIDILPVRFDMVPDAIIAMIHSIDDLAVLKQLHRDAMTVSSLDTLLAGLRAQER